MKLNGVNWSAAACLLWMTLCYWQSERRLQREVDQFHSVCSRRKPRVNAGKNKVMVFERKEVQVINFGNPYKVSVPVDERCEIVIGGERIEVVREFKYL